MPKINAPEVNWTELNTMEERANARRAAAKRNEVVRNYRHMIAKPKRHPLIQWLRDVLELD